MCTNPRTASSTIERATLPLAALPSEQAARYIGVEPKTLGNWRAKGIGPTYVRHGKSGGRVSYLISDLDEYLAIRRVAA